MLLTVCAESVVCLQWDCWGGDRRAGAACTQGARPGMYAQTAAQCITLWLHSLPWP